MKRRSEATEDLVREISLLRQRVTELESFREGYKRLEQALNQSELRFRTLADKSLVGIYIVGESHFCYVNPKFAEIFGYYPDELIHVKEMQTLVHDDDLRLA
ncbi:MAG: PAS domain S-box protein, partial [Desulfomonile tiedjei]|nr:PAS domain S-box protein [Desulfomonile tiedjei]